MPNNRIQKCLTINKNNVDIIGKALKEYWSREYHSGHTINEIDDARGVIIDIKKQMEKLNEIKICWG